MSQNGTRSHSRSISVAFLVLVAVAMSFCKYYRCNRWRCKEKHKHPRHLPSIVLDVQQYYLHMKNECHVFPCSIYFPLTNCEKYENCVLTDEFNMNGCNFVTQQLRALCQIFATEQKDERLIRIRNEWICAIRKQWDIFIISKSVQYTKQGYSIGNAPRSNICEYHCCTLAYIEPYGMTTMLRT